MKQNRQNLFSHSGRGKESIIYHYFFLAVMILWVTACKPSEDATKEVQPKVLASSFDMGVASYWVKTQLYLCKKGTGFTPPVTSRAFGYAGVTLYESVVGGMPSNNSLSGQLSGLSNVPKADAAKEYNWALAANAAEAFIVKKLFVNPVDSTKYYPKIDSLEQALNVLYKVNVTTEVLERSKAYGKAVAAAIYNWSKTDGGDEGYKRNFPTSYKVPVFVGAWQPTENNIQNPMQPFWGANRLFVEANGKLAMPKPIDYSTKSNSPYFIQYNEVYQKNKILTQEEKEISVWWSDNPGDTSTPPGHSVSIANIALQKVNAKLDKAAEGFAKTGIAVADAFILCWKCKFTYNNERPYTYVRYAIDPSWKPFWPAPPFPGFPSGHATQAGAVCEVLTNLFGDNFAFTDDSYEGRANDPLTGTAFKSRSFASFKDFAVECANSRFYGGIHTHQDNDEGMKNGVLVGKNVNALKFKK
ncbi:PAP2 superfamily protein [Pseudarcicella hirudinis]|uniref:PAP2 superfamily protein n=1 Tax=Pseudarcicella hirudinis TaxID=1079859 RepID=A0A1I5NYU2_9BACT|nr:vanadium-dependent haloperoxidase [Pseudarcicella hirudinis]SFP26974.1 PAP2 superfamily protein [Pseudarcicella hirudinis]